MGLTGAGWCSIIYLCNNFFPGNYEGINTLTLLVALEPPGVTLGAVPSQVVNESQQVRFLKLQTIRKVIGMAAHKSTELNS